MRWSSARRGRSSGDTSPCPRTALSLHRFRKCWRIRSGNFPAWWWARAVDSARPGEWSSLPHRQEVRDDASRPLSPVPAETARFANVVSPQGQPYRRATGEFGAMITDDAFAALFLRGALPARRPTDARAPAAGPGTPLQFAEGLSGRQAVDAVRARLDRECVLRPEPGAAGCDAAVLCASRGRRAAGAAHTPISASIAVWDNRGRRRPTWATYRQPNTEHSAGRHSPPHIDWSAPLRNSSYETDQSLRTPPYRFAACARGR